MASISQGTPYVGNGDKRKVLSINEKLDLLKKFDSGASVRQLSEMFGVGSSTVYDLKKQKTKLRQFYARSKTREDMNSRKTMRYGKNKDLDRALMQWIRECRNEGVLEISSEMVVIQARILHEQLKLEHKCHYSDGWLYKFKLRNGLLLKPTSSRRKKLIEEKDTVVAAIEQNAEECNTSEEQVCSNHFVDGCPTIMNPLPTLNIDPPPKDKESKRKSGNIFKLSSKPHKSLTERRNLYSKSQVEYQEQSQQQQQQQQQQQLAKLTETVKGVLQRPPNKVLEQLQCVDESRNEKLIKHMLYQMSPHTQNKPQQKVNISAALGKPANTERSRKSPLNTASTSHSISSNIIEVENTSPPAKKAREIHIDIDESDEEPTVVSKPLLQPTIESPVQKSTSVKSAPDLHNSVLDINTPPQKQKRILVVPNHQQSVMSNLSSLWKAGRLCDAFISNGIVNVKVHKMILGAVCPKVLDVFYNTPQHKLPKVTFPSHVSKEALLAFAEYMYNGVLDLDPELLAQMRVIAQRLDMKDFEQLCSNQLKSHMVPNMLPTILEPMLSEPCSSSGLLQQMSPQGNQSSVMEVIPAANRSLQKDVYTSDSLTNISSAVGNSSVSSLSNLPLVEVRAETDASLMEVVNNNLSFSAASDNICDDDNTNSRTLVKIEKVDAEDQQYGRVPVSSAITYSTSDTPNTSNFTHFSKTDLSESPSSSTSTSQHTNSTQNKSLTVGHTWKQSKDKTSTGEDADPYPINLFTASWANVPLLSQEIKKEYNVG